MIPAPNAGSSPHKPASDVRCLADLAGVPPAWGWDGK